MAQRRTMSKKRSFLAHYMKDEVGHNISAACKLTGISRGCYVKWRKQDKWFAQRCTRIESNKADVYLDHLFEQSAAGKTPATIFALCNLDKERFRNTQSIDHTGQIPDSTLKLEIVYPDKKLPEGQPVIEGEVIESEEDNG